MDDATKISSGCRFWLSVYIFATYKGISSRPTDERPEQMPSPLNYPAWFLSSISNFQQVLNHTPYPPPSELLTSFKDGPSQLSLPLKGRIMNVHKFRNNFCCTIFCNVFARNLCVLFIICGKKTSNIKDVIGSNFWQPVDQMIE